MKTIHIEQVRVAFRYHWNAWPIGSDGYDDILAERREFTIDDGDLRFEVRERIYPVHLAFLRAGDLNLPVRPGDINNLRPPSQRVLDQYVTDLTALAADGVQSIVWEHAMNCYPYMAQHIKRLFRLSILTFGDDCPGSSEIKTFPVAGNFDALIYNMFVWNGETGERTSSKYQALGIPYRCFRPNSETVGIEKYIADSGFRAEDKIARMAVGQCEQTLVFVGAGFGGSRMALVKGLAAQRQQLASEGITVHLLGAGMPDGLAVPFQPPHPLGLGYPLGSTYASVAYGLNTPISSIFNCRLIDLWRMGVLQFLHDRHGELREFGFLPDVHYAAFDGTVGGLIHRLRRAKEDPMWSSTIARNALSRLEEFKAETSETRVFGEIYRAHLPQLEGGARQVVLRDK